MAKILLDVSAASTDWFQRAIQELRHSKSVKFLYSDQEKYKREILRVPKLARFLVEMRDSGRRVDAPEAQVQAIVDDLEEDPAWIAYPKYCDDPHLFAIMAVGHGNYVLTDEKRLARCRNCIANARKDLCQFKTIRTYAVFKKARAKLLKP